jgi:GT2 family glycosyltransferase
VAPGLLDRLSEAVAAHPDYAVLGPVILFMDSPDTVMTDGCIFNDPAFNGFFQRKEVPVTNSAPPAVTDVDVVNGCCMLVRADVFERAGLFDEHLFIYHDETDFCLRAKAAGYRAGVIDHALIWHKGSATSKATGKKSIRYFDARNLLYVLRKHGGARAHGRTMRASAAGYARYMFYWYCSEREAGNDAAAAAVIDGVCDGLAGRGGPYTAGRRLLAPPIRIAFEALRRRPQALRGAMSS